jgi:hypothetical protein
MCDGPAIRNGPQRSMNASWVTRKVLRDCCDVRFPAPRRGGGVAVSGKLRAGGTFLSLIDSRDGRDRQEPRSAAILPLVQRIGRNRTTIAFERWHADGDTAAPWSDVLRPCRREGTGSVCETVRRPSWSSGPRPRSRAGDPQPACLDASLAPHCDTEIPLRAEHASLDAIMSAARAGGAQCLGRGTAIGPGLGEGPGWLPNRRSMPRGRQAPAVTPARLDPQMSRVGVPRGNTRRAAAEDHIRQDFYPAPAAWPAHRNAGDTGMGCTLTGYKRIAKGRDGPAIPHHPVARVHSGPL